MADSTERDARADEARACKQHTYMFPRMCMLKNAHKVSAWKECRQTGCCWTVASQDFVPNQLHSLPQAIGTHQTQQLPRC